MMDEQLVYKTVNSICYRRGDIFRKYFNYPDKENIEREILYSKIAYDNGIPTPKFISYGYSEKYNTQYIEFEYLNLETYMDRIKKTNINIKDIITITEKMNNIIPHNNDNLWNENRMIDFYNTLSIANEKLSGSTEKDMQKIKNLPCNNFIHGDLTETNVCFCDEKIYIVDFENACMGPGIWDKCFFFASAFTKEIPEEIDNLITQEELEIIQIIAKIRYGRAIRKNVRVEERANSCLIWHSV